MIDTVPVTSLSLCWKETHVKAGLFKEGGKAGPGMKHGVGGGGGKKEVPLAGGSRLTLLVLCGPVEKVRTTVQHQLSRK